MKKIFTTLSLTLILLSGAGSTIMTAFAVAPVPNQIQVSGITGTYADANGIYTKQSIRSSMGVGSSVNNTHYSTNYDRYYWQRTSGSNNYYIYLSQYSSSAAYYWNVDINQEDLTSNVLFYNGEPNAGGGYNVDNGDVIPQSPDLVSSWSNSGTLGSGSITVTIPAIAPTVTTQAVSDISYTTATGNGTITALGVPNPTAYGVCWSTTATPTISNSKIDKGAATVTGAFTAAITGLTANTTYHVRAYATNSGGTSYGDEVTFTTNMATGLGNATANTLVFYPNPATDGFTINTGEKITRVSIYDLSGALVLSQQAAEKSVIDISSLQAGVYMVKVNGLVEKLIKK